MTHYFCLLSQLRFTHLLHPTPSKTLLPNHTVFLNPYLTISFQEFFLSIPIISEYSNGYSAEVTNCLFLAHRGCVGEMIANNIFSNECLRKSDLCMRDPHFHMATISRETNVSSTHQHFLRQIFFRHLQIISNRDFHFL